MQEWEEVVVAVVASGRLRPAKARERGGEGAIARDPEIRILSLATIPSAAFVPWGVEAPHSRRLLPQPAEWLQVWSWRRRGSRRTRRVKKPFRSKNEPA